MDLNILPLTVFEEIGKHLDLKGFIALISVSKGLRDKILRSNIKIRGINLLFEKDDFPILLGKNKLYKKYESHFTDIKVRILCNSDEIACKILDNISDIYTLDLSSCNITNLTLKGLTKFKNLRTLDLSQCYGITYREIKLISLESLNLSACLSACSSGGETLVIDLLAHTNLESLYLSLITDKGIKALGELTNLRELHLCYCDKITDQGAEAIALSFTNLERLHISQSRITDRGVKAIASLTKLRVFELSYCPNITKEGVEAIARSLINLRELDLSHCENIFGLPKNFGNLKHLCELNLSGCSNIGNGSIKSLSLLPNLHTLDIDGCDNITNETLESLGNIKVLFEYFSGAIVDN